MKHRCVAHAGIETARAVPAGGHEQPVPAPANRHAVLSCRWELAPSSQGGTQMVARWTAEPLAVDAAPVSRTDGQSDPGARAEGQAA